jgi:hypothetical protein
MHGVLTGGTKAVRNQMQATSAWHTSQSSLVSGLGLCSRSESASDMFGRLTGAPVAFLLLSMHSSSSRKLAVAGSPARCFHFATRSSSIRLQLELMCASHWVCGVLQVARFTHQRSPITFAAC